MTGQDIGGDAEPLNLPPFQLFLTEQTGGPLSTFERLLRFDWKGRAVDWSWSQPSVRHQGVHQTCTSHAAATMVEAVNRAAGDTSGTLSPSYIHACIGGVAPNQGLDPLRLLRRIAEGKLTPPYEGSQPWPPARCGVTSGVMLPRLREVRGDDHASVLLGRSPLVASLAIGQEFMNLETTRYEPSQPTLGHHTVCILAETSYGWLVQNSFGADWGNLGGLFEIARGVGGLLQPGFSAVAIA